eukprot:1158676-Pelagomonas_calceolata.AAC.3
MMYMCQSCGGLLEQSGPTDMLFLVFLSHTYHANHDFFIRKLHSPKRGFTPQLIRHGSRHGRPKEPSLRGARYGTPMQRAYTKEAVQRGRGRGRGRGKRRASGRARSRFDDYDDEDSEVRGICWVAMLTLTCVQLLRHE